MARKAEQLGVLPTIWNVSDELWPEVAAVVAEHDPPAQFGPERIDQRKAFDGVIYRTRRLPAAAYARLLTRSPGPLWCTPGSPDGH